MNATKPYTEELLSMALRLQERQRNVIAGYLHDEVGQVLSGIGLQVEVLRLDSLASAPALSGRIAEVQQMLENVIAQVRRINTRLLAKPSNIEELRSAVRNSVELYRSRFRGGIRVDIESGADIPAEAAAAFDGIVLEALDNAVRHAGATEIRIASGGEVGWPFGIEVSDNGRGAVAGWQSGSQGLGFRLMQGLAQQADLRLVVQAAAGRGTIVRAILSQASAAGIS